MPGLTVGNVHVNAPLTNLARIYRPQEDGFIADEVCPILPVVKESDLYYVWTQGDFFATDVDDLVADRAAPRRLEFTASTETYTCVRRELAWDISDRERRNADNQLRLEETKQRGILGRLMLLREIRVAGILQDVESTLTIGGISVTGQLDASVDAAAAAKWDAANTTYQSIYGDVMAAIERVRKSIGLRPNVIVIPAAVAAGLGKSKFFDAANGSIITAAVSARQVPAFTDYPLLPPVLWGMRVLVPGQIANTAKEGKTESYSDIWGETVRLLYVTPGPAMDTPSVAYTFQSEARTTRQWRDEERRVDAFATGYTAVEKVVAPLAAATITDCLT